MRAADGTWESSGIASRVAPMGSARSVTVTKSCRHVLQRVVVRCVPEKLRAKRQEKDPEVSARRVCGQPQACKADNGEQSRRGGHVDNADVQRQGHPRPQSSPHEKVPGRGEGAEEREDVSPGRSGSPLSCIREPDNGPADHRNSDSNHARQAAASRGRGKRTPRQQTAGWCSRIQLSSSRTWSPGSSSRIRNGGRAARRTRGRVQGLRPKARGSRRGNGPARQARQRRRQFPFGGPLWKARECPARGRRRSESPPRKPQPRRVRGRNQGLWFVGAGKSCRGACIDIFDDCPQEDKGGDA